MGPFFSGAKLNPMDLSPNYSGFQMALGNGLGALTGVIGPYLVGVMTPDVTFRQTFLSFALNSIILICRVNSLSGVGFFGYRLSL